jgi:hypothetical protein
MESSDRRTLLVVIVAGFLLGLVFTALRFSQSPLLVIVGMVSMVVASVDALRANQALGYTWQARLTYVGLLALVTGAVQMAFSFFS